MYVARGERRVCVTRGRGEDKAGGGCTRLEEGVRVQNGTEEGGRRFDLDNYHHPDTFGLGTYIYCAVFSD